MRIAAAIVGQRKSGVGVDCLIGSGKLAQCSIDSVAWPLAERTNSGSTDCWFHIGVHRNIEENLTSICSQDAE